METVMGDPRRIWKRVAPTLEPWPGVDAIGKALRNGAKVDGVTLGADAASRNDKRFAGTSRSLAPAAETLRNLAPDETPRNPGLAASRSLGPVITPEETFSAPDDAILPGAEPDPCCMGSEAETDTAVLIGFAEDEYAERRQLQALSRQAPVWARQTLLTLAAHAAARAKKSIAAYYLITAETYPPAICTEKIYVGKFLPALRERYHSAACTAMNYERAADGAADPCLNALFRELSADAFECAAAVMRLLERALT